MKFTSTLVVLIVTVPSVRAFTIRTSSRTSHSALSAVGIFFGTSTGSTQEAAELIAASFPKGDAVGPIDIDDVKEELAEEFAKYDALIVGTPTWNTGADTERSGVGWDEIYYGAMQDLNLKDKKVAVFGLGDSISYSDNYADATGELHDVFQRLGANMLGYTSQEGYEHKSSKAIREDLFCGLLLDAVNQEELSQDRVEGWVQQLLEEGILEGSTATNGAEAAAPSVAPLVIPATVLTVVNGDGDIHALIAKLEQENAALRKKLEDNSSLLEESMHDGFIPHVNARTGRTMWVSPNGRACYYTERKASIKVSP